MIIKRKVRTTYTKPFGYVVFPACGHVQYLRCDPATTEPPTSINCMDCVARAQELPTRGLALLQVQTVKPPKAAPKIKRGSRVVVVGHEAEGAAVATRFLRDVEGWTLDRKIGGFYCWPPESLRIQAENRAGK